jgi:hypothetical protein
MNFMPSPRAADRRRQQDGSKSRRLQGAGHHRDRPAHGEDPGVVELGEDREAVLAAEAFDGASAGADEGADDLVDALGPVLFEQRLGARRRGRGEAREQRGCLFQRRTVEVDGQHGRGLAVGVPQHRADRGQAPSVGRQRTRNPNRG